MSELAVSGCSLELQGGFSAATMQITSLPSADIKINGKGVYFGDIDVALASVQDPSKTSVCATGKITIHPTAGNILSGTDKAVQNGDSGSATLTFTNTTSGATALMSVTVKISDAGQTDVTAS